MLLLHPKKPEKKKKKKRERERERRNDIVSREEERFCRVLFFARILYSNTPQKPSVLFFDDDEMMFAI